MNGETNSQVQAHCDKFLLQAIHDLRAPLRDSLIHLELLLPQVRASALSEACEAHLLAIQEGNRRVELLLRRLSEFCVAGTAIERAPKAPLSFLVQQAVAGLGLGAEEPRVVIGSLPEIALPAPVQKLVAELLDNARKFSPPEGVIEIRAFLAGTEVIGEIRDNGIGFDHQRHATRIFEPLIRLHGVGEYRGFGLGLAIGRRIVEALHGRLWAEPAAAGGSAFLFALPLEEPITETSVSTPSTG
jgi:signal transduction histidine kinase